MEVEIFSEEIIKPSSQTPDHIRSYQLSFLDQLSPRLYNPFIYYYSSNDTDFTDISCRLKKSLSQALTLYYPLAGKLEKDSLTLDCNDDGVRFFEARVISDTNLSGIIDSAVPRELNKLLPFDLDEPAESLLGVKLTAFPGGGITVGVCVSHRISDALSSLMFVRTWTAISRREVNSVQKPEFISASLFPVRDVAGYDNTGVVSNLDDVVTKRFVFNGPKVEDLKKRHNHKKSENWKSPSRVSVLSAFLWHRFVAVVNDGESFITTKKLFTSHHTVNLRPKLNPPLSDHSFGNYYRTSTTIVPSISEKTLDPNLAGKIAEDIRRVDKGFVENIQVNGDEFMESIKRGSEMFQSGNLVPLVFSSLCRFPLYSEADFGFGYPIWVSSAARGFKNTVGFIDDKTGHGIEAYVTLSPRDMVKLEADQEFLAFVSPNPKLHVN